MNGLCDRCGLPTTGWRASARCSCPSEPLRKTMSRNRRIAELTDEGVLAAFQRITGLDDRQVRSEDRSRTSESHLGRAARRARAAQRAAGYSPEED